MADKLYPTFISGNIVTFEIGASQHDVELIFPTSFKKIQLMQGNVTPAFWRYVNMTVKRSQAVTIPVYTPISFPVISGKSPCTLKIYKSSNSALNMTYLIEEVGGVPFEKYWDNTIDTINGTIDSDMVGGIVTQPQNTSARDGETARFSVVCSGSIASYQWQYKYGMSWEDSGSTGSTTPTISITMRTGLDGYQYRCLIIDMYGNVLTSDAATLTLDDTPAPENQSKVENDEIKDEKEGEEDERIDER